MNQRLLNRIRCKINELGEKRAWSKIAKECVDDYNNIIHSSTGFTPAYLLKGEAKTIISIELQDKGDIFQNKKIAFENSLKAHENNKKKLDILNRRLRIY